MQKLSVRVRLKAQSLKIKMLLKMKKIQNKDVIRIRETIQSLIEEIDTFEQSRFTSIVKTKLEEAQMWAGNLFSKDKTDGIIKRD